MVSIAIHRIYLSSKIDSVEFWVDSGEFRGMVSL